MEKVLITKAGACAYIELEESLKSHFCGILNWLDLCLKDNYPHNAKAAFMKLLSYTVTFFIRFKWIHIFHVSLSRIKIQTTDAQ